MVYEKTFAETCWLLKRQRAIYHQLSPRERVGLGEHPYDRPMTPERLRALALA